MGWTTGSLPLAFDSAKEKQSQEKTEQDDSESTRVVSEPMAGLSPFFLRVPSPLVILIGLQLAHLWLVLPATHTF